MAAKGAVNIKYFSLDITKQIVYLERLPHFFLILSFNLRMSVNST